MAKQQALGKRREARPVGLGALHPPSPTLDQLLCEAIPPPLPLGPHISSFETIPTSNCAFLQLDLNCCTKISPLPKTTSSEELGFPVFSKQSIFPYLPTHRVFVGKARGCDPRPVAQCGSAARGFFITISVSPYVGSPNHVLHIPGARQSESHGLQF